MLGTGDMGCEVTVWNGLQERSLRLRPVKQAEGGLKT